MQWSHADLKKMIHFNKVIFAAPVTSSQRVHQLSPALTSCRIIKLRLNHSRDEDLKQHSLWFTLQTDIFYEQALAFKETLILFASAFMQTGRTNDSDSFIFCSAACINGHHYLSTRFMLLWWMMDKYQLISDHDHHMLHVQRSLYHETHCIFARNVILCYHCMLH